MTNVDARDFTGWIGHTVISPSGEKIGKVSEVYVDDQSGQPEWVAINTGLFKTRSSFAPLRGAETRGDDLAIPYDKDKVKDAPQVEDDGDGYLSPEEEEALYRYYGQEYATGASGRRPAEDEARTGYAGRDASGTRDDEAMTRSEEQLRVGTARQEAGRARLRKYVVTENVQTTVPVSHEEVRVEREPITDANRAAAMGGPDISEAEHEVVLNEERPVVAKETVPVERVRLGKETVTDEERVSEEVRKERIETEGAQGHEARER